MLEYQWKILSIYVSPQENSLLNVVKRVTWKYQVKDNQYVADIYKDTYFNSVDSNQYISYENLTDETVFGWISNTEDMDQLKAELEEKLIEIKNPSRVVEKVLPWTEQYLYTGNELYALFKGEELLIGPSCWSSNVFNDALEKVKLQPSFPPDAECFQRRILPTKEPLVVDQQTNTKLYLVTVLNEQPEDDIFNKNDYIVWDLNTWPVEATYDTVYKPIDEVKFNLLNVLNQRKYEKEFEKLTLTIDGQDIEFNPNLNLLIILNSKYQLLNEEDKTVVCLSTENQVELTKNQVLEVLNSIKSRYEEIDNWGYSKYLEIVGASSIDELKLVGVI